MRENGIASDLVFYRGADHVAAESWVLTIPVVDRPPEPRTQ